MRHTTLKAPFGWVGGKSRLAKEIISYMPPHKLYIEVFGGALSVLYAKEKPNSAKYREVVNDINEELINLHKQIQKKPESLSFYAHQMLISRHLFYAIKQGKLKPRNDIQRASFYLFLLSQSFGSKGDNFAMNVKSRKPKDIYRSFKVYSQRLKLVTIEQMSFDKLIKTYDKDEAFFYCDPPYVGTENYYKNMPEFDMSSHRLPRDTLKNIKGKFLLSYNDCKETRELYKGFNIKEAGVKYSLGGGSQKETKELIIMNY